MAGTSQDYVDQVYAAKAAAARNADPLQNNLFWSPIPSGPEPQPLPYDDNPILNVLRGIANAGINTGQQAWNTLQAPAAAVRAVAGGGNQDVGQQRIHQAAQYAPIPGFQDMPQGVKELAADVATDPLTFVGVGAPAKAAQTATNPNVIRILRTLERAEQGTQETLQALFQTLPAAAAKGTLQHVPLPKREIMDVVQPGQTVGSFQPGDIYPRDVSNIWDAFTATSARTHFKHYLRDLVDSIKILNGKGWDLDKVMVDQDRFSELVRYPGGDQAIANLRAGQLDLNREVRAATDPLLRIGGLELIKQREEQVYRAFAQANLRIEDARQAGTAGQALQDFTNTVLEDAYFTASRATASARDVFGELTQRIADIPPMPPQLAQDVQRETGLALNRYARAYQWMGQRTGQGPPGTPLADLSTLRGGMHATLTGVQPGLGQSRTILQGAPQPIRDAADALVGQEGLGASLRQRIDQMEHGEAGIPSFMADLPPELQSRTGRALKDFLGYGTQVRGERQRIVNAVQEAWQLRNPGGAMPAFTPDKPYEWVTDVFHQLGVLEPTKSITSSTEIPARLMNILSPGTIAKLQGDLQGPARTGIAKFPAGDVFTTDAFDLVVDRVGRQYAKNLGLNDEKPISTLIQQATALYKEGTLATPTYILTNLMGALFMGALRGVNPMPIVRDLQSNLFKAWNGQPVTTKAFENLMANYGIQAPPQSLLGATSMLTETSVVRDYLKKGLTASAAIGPLALGAAGGGAGAVSGALSAPRDATPGERAQSMVVGATAGAVGGATLPITSKYLLTRLSQSLETILRQNAYSTGFLRTIETPKLYQIADDALAKTQRTVNPGAGLTATVQTTTPNASGVRQVIQAQQGQIAPVDLEKLLVREGVDGATARQAGKDWESVIQEASREGQKFAHSIHFDYENLNNFEDFARTWLPFSTWAFKAYPFFAEQIAKSPLLLVTVRELQERSDREREQRGLSPRFIGTVPVDSLSTIWSTILGRPVETGVNPLRGLVPFSDTVRMLGAGGGDESPLGAIADTIGAFGPGLHPLIEAGTRVLGLRGDAPAEGYLGGLARLVPGATGTIGGVNRGAGVDLNRVFTGPETAIREAVTSRLPGAAAKVTDLNSIAVLKRLDELAIERTGQTTESGAAPVAPFIQAKSSRQGPVWDEAARQVAQERALRSTSGVLFQGITPQAIQSETEGKIREARTTRLTPDELTTKITTAVKANPQQLLGEDVVGPLRAIVAEASKDLPGGQMAPSAQAFFATPSAWTAQNLDKVRKEVAQYQVRQNPLIQGYTGQGNPEEQDLSNQLASYYNLPALMSADPAYAGLPPQDMQGLADFARTANANTPLAEFSRGFGKGADDIVLGQLKKVQENYRATHPLLDAYLSYQLAKRNSGTMEDFLKNRPR